MIAFKFTLFALLLLVIQNTLALETSAAVMEKEEVDTASSQREVMHHTRRKTRRDRDRDDYYYYVKSHKSPKSRKPKKQDLVAKIDKGSNDFGEIVVSFKSGDMDKISYDLTDMPKKCKDCYMAIHKKKCGGSTGAYLWTSGSWSNNPKWKKEGKITTSQDGNAAGTIFGIDSGYDFKSNKGKWITIFDDDGDKIGCGKLKED
jgi:hypothetical protein